MELYSYQKQLVDEFPYKYGIWGGTGVGKTIIAISLANKADIETLIVCPKGQKTNWKENCKAYAAVPYKILTKEEMRRDGRKLKKYNAVIIDECHHHVGEKSKMSKEMRWYFNHHDVKYRWLLTATPYRSQAMDVWVICELLGKPMKKSRFFHNFYRMVRMGPRMVPQERKYVEWEGDYLLASEALAQILNTVGVTFRLEDYNDVPEQVYEVEHFTLNKEQEEAMTEAFDPRHIVRFTREHQICGGTLKGDEFVESQIFPSDKMDRVVDIASSEDMVIIACRYNHELEVLHEKIPDSYVINGSVAGEERHRILKELEEKKKGVLLVNAAVSEGWEWPSCPLMVFYSLDFSLVNYQQLLGRIQRAHNIKKNRYVHLVVKGTVDEDIYKTVVIKKRDFIIKLYEK